MCKSPIQSASCLLTSLFAGDCDGARSYGFFHPLPAGGGGGGGALVIAWGGERGTAGEMRKICVCRSFHQLLAANDKNTPREDGSLLNLRRQMLDGDKVRKYRASAWLRWKENTQLDPRDFPTTCEEAALTHPRTPKTS